LKNQCSSSGKKRDAEWATAVRLLLNICLWFKTEFGTWGDTSPSGDPIYRSPFPSPSPSPFSDHLHCVGLLFLPIARRCWRLGHAKVTCKTQIMICWPCCWWHPTRLQLRLPRRQQWNCQVLTNKFEDFEEIYLC